MEERRNQPLCRTQIATHPAESCTCNDLVSYRFYASMVSPASLWSCCRVRPRGASRSLLGLLSPSLPSSSLPFALCRSVERNETRLRVICSAYVSTTDHSTLRAFAGHIPMNGHRQSIQACSRSRSRVLHFACWEYPSVLDVLLQSGCASHLPTPHHGVGSSREQDYPAGYSARTGEALWSVPGL